MRRSGLSAALAALVLLVLAIPALSLDFGNGALRQFPAGNETRAGIELAQSKLAPGASAPTLIVADFKRRRPSPATEQQLIAYVAEPEGHRRRRRGATIRSPPTTATPR